MYPQGPLGANLFVIGFPDSTEDMHLWQLFAPFGPLISARVFRDKVRGMRLAALS